MEIMLQELLPHILTGVAAGLVAWGGVKIEMRWLRRDVDSLRFTVYSSENENNLVSVVQKHSWEIEALKEAHGRADGN